jgi:hypothetical protein
MKFELNESKKIAKVLQLSLALEMQPKLSLYMQRMHRIPSISVRTFADILVKESERRNARKLRVKTISNYITYVNASVPVLDARTYFYRCEGSIRRNEPLIHHQAHASSSCFSFAFSFTVFSCCS